MNREGDGRLDQDVQPTDSQPIWHRFRSRGTGFPGEKGTRNDSRTSKMVSSGSVADAGLLGFSGCWCGDPRRCESYSFPERPMAVQAGPGRRSLAGQQPENWKAPILWVPRAYRALPHHGLPGGQTWHDLTYRAAGRWRAIRRRPMTIPITPPACTAMDRDPRGIPGQPS